MAWTTSSGCACPRLPPRARCARPERRRQRAAEGAKRAGREAGNPRRETARPTAERLLEAFEGLTLTVVVTGCQQTERHITTLSPLQQRLLEILGFSLALYTRLCTVSSEPPEKWANRKS